MPVFDAAFRLLDEDGLLQFWVGDEDAIVADFVDFDRTSCVLLFCLFVCLFLIAGPAVCVGAGNFVH